MGANHHDFAWIQTQLTVTRWHLDAAGSAAAEAVRHHVEQAQSVFGVTVGRLAVLQLSTEERDSIERELSEVRARLEAAGEVMWLGPDGPTGTV